MFLFSKILLNKNLGYLLVSVYAFITILLQILRTDLNLFADPLSNFGVKWTAIIFSLSLFILGSSTILIGYKSENFAKNYVKDQSANNHFSFNKNYHLGTKILFIFSGLATMGVGIFPISEIFIINLIHGIMASIAFIGTALGYISLFRNIKVPIFVLTSGLNIFFLIIYGLFRPDGFVGLFQKLTVLTIVLNSMFLHNYLDKVNQQKNSAKVK